MPSSPKKRNPYLAQTFFAGWSFVPYISGKVEEEKEKSLRVFSALSPRMKGCSFAPPPLSSGSLRTPPMQKRKKLYSSELKGGKIAMSDFSIF